ncbi:MAG: DUF1559 domain-containing protein [Pirellulales bacterium]
MSCQVAASHVRSGQPAAAVAPNGLQPTPLMPIPFHCPHCGRRTEVDERFAGQSGPCLDCGGLITIPPLEVARPAQQRQRIIHRENVGLIVTVATAVISILLVAGLAAFRYWPQYFGVTTAEGRSQACRDQLREIGVALLAYEADHGRLPPAVVYDNNGKPLYSWRVLLLPYLGPDARGIYAQYRLEEPWDSPTNSLAGNKTPSVYRCPADSSIVMAETSYLLVTGPGTLYDGKVIPSTQLANAGDGADQIVLVVESHGSGVGWAEPKDIDIVQLARGVNSSALRTVRSAHGQTAHALTVDGHVLVLPDSVSGAELRALATCDGDETLANLPRWQAP